MTTFSALVLCQLRQSPVVGIRRKRIIRKHYYNSVGCCAMKKAKAGGGGGGGGGGKKGGKGEAAELKTCSHIKVRHILCEKVRELSVAGLTRSSTPKF